jgi:hypothetical protein
MRLREAKGWVKLRLEPISSTVVALDHYAMYVFNLSDP